MQGAVTLDTPIRRQLADAMIARYDEWRQACEGVRATDPVWSPEAPVDRALSFAAHQAAIDREELAAARYAEAVEDLRRLLWTPTPRLRILGFRK